MESELIFKRDDGSKIKIAVNLYLPSFHDPEYRVGIFTCAKGKRSWVYQDCTNHYAYRELKFGSKEREEYEHKFHLSFASEDEIQKAKTALWEKLKP